MSEVANHQQMENTLAENNSSEIRKRLKESKHRTEKENLGNLNFPTIILLPTKLTRIMFLPIRFFKFSVRYAKIY